LWNVAEQTALMETNNAPFIRFSTNGQYLTMLDEEAARLRVWQSDTGALLATIATGLELDERGGPTGIGPFDNKALAVSNDGRWVALGDMTGRVQVWEVSSGSLLHTLLGHTSGIWCLDFSPDSHFLLSSSGGYIATQGNILVSFDPGTTESTARLWNLDTGREDRRFVFASPVTQVYFTADQTALVTVSGGVLRVWDADYRALVAYACSQAVRDLTEVERGQYAVGEDRTCPNS
jgi:WD40 repeat protein